MVLGEFLFLVTKSLKSRRLDLLSNHDICFPNFSFSSRNWRKLQISRFFANILVLFSNQKTDLDISLLEIRDMNSIFLFSISLFGISSMPAQLHILLHFIVNLQSLSVFLHPASQIRFTGRFSHKTRKVVNILGFTKVHLFYLDLAGKTHLNLGFQCNVVSSVHAHSVHAVESNGRREIWKIH